MMSPSGAGQRDLHLDAVTVEPDIPRLLAEGVQSSFLELSWVFLTRTRRSPDTSKAPPPENRQGTRQPRTTIASRTSTPRRFSSKRTLPGIVKVGIEV